jgi:predicted ATP-dependent Lon-type protease
MLKQMAVNYPEIYPRPMIAKKSLIVDAYFSEYQIEQLQKRQQTDSVKRFLNFYCHVHLSSDASLHRSRSPLIKLAQSVTSQTGRLLLLQDRF